MKRFFLINPVSGGGMDLQSFEEVRHFFRTKTGDFWHILTRGKEDVEFQVREAVSQGAEQIVVLGGDGTLNQVVNTLFKDGRPLNKELVLAVAKWGTGSDYLRTINAKNPKVDWKEAVLNFSVREVDLGEATFETGERRLFINMCSTGISAFIANAKEKNPSWLPRRLNYIVPTLRSFVQYEASRARVTVDERVYDGELVSAFVSKGIYAGGGMRFGGGVEVDDGFFDIKLFHKMSTGKMFAHSKHLYSGNFEHIPEIQVLKGKNVKIEAARPLLVETEGEICGQTDLSVQLIPKALKVCFPLA